MKSQKQIADMERSLMSCTRFRRHRVRCFMEQEVRHGEKAHGYEYVARFALGGLATVFAGVIAELLGPETGGLFLAFPAIFCASATLVEKHERDQKAKKGVQGEERGRCAAALDAVGAGWGSLALAVFAITVWTMAPYGAASSLGLASAAWVLVALGFFFLRRNIRRG
jgi:Protein of unknown function (DUF3147)